MRTRILDGADLESKRTSIECAPGSYANADGRVASSDLRKPKKQVHATAHSMTVLKSTSHEPPYDDRGD